MANATINRIHFIISGTLAAAVRWGWIATNPASVAKKPRVPAPQPNPPTSEQAARILAAAWEVDVDWGTLVWLVMVTGLRRGELLALKWSDVDFDTETLVVRRGIVKVGSRVIEKDTKTHRMRRIALDAETMRCSRNTGPPGTSKRLNFGWTHWTSRTSSRTSLISRSRTTPAASPTGTRACAPASG
ncbi:site-specific integrase [Sporichthya polymorpha]|uniref:site-specific integrase n=1 Tax=Sporichthya polymorpha TaxID=35751 RepID=UPI001B7FB57B|nr:site-specific integrase [Sporichthya polymorpha]